ncbi:hypothetical protein H8S95_14065 [Pontibacter sp. KCTC 32443]|uniref:DUF5996 family protein n=1 Tax=Pontibacter TaxID=323449 RepID=UPI00164E6859|nr:MULTISPECIES: DUF5996 family protein [Pontibacter]MBC5775200.1 hypothetical protein [Pontibacter sp. KCTC 32443]
MKTGWPELNYHTSKDTLETLHLWTQIIGKIKLQMQPWVNHSWHVTLSVSPTGLTTGDLSHQGVHFQVDLNLVQHQLSIKTNAGQKRSFALFNMPVAEFYKKVMHALADLGIDVHIYKVPCELENPIPFDEDQTHKTYDPAQATALHQALLKAQEVLQQFRAKFRGKCSPVHFFWGSFDLAVSRFSGRTAPKHPGGVPNLPDWVAQEAYSHEVYSCGFWPGSEALPEAAFYAYIYPEPDGYRAAEIEPAEAYFHETLGEFILPYEAVRKADDPEAVLLSFLESSYEAAANLAKWDRQALEC